MRVVLIIVSLLLVAGIAFTQLFTVFVIQPIGAIPEGATLVVSRLDRGKFIDSADAMCEREAGGVSLLCRGAMLAAVGATSKIYARLPYSDTLYKISTDGREYH